MNRYPSLFSDMEIKEVELPIPTSESLTSNRYIIVSKFTDVKSQQNNGAELLALLFALRIASKEKKITCIKCDSDLLVKWWTKNGPNPTTKSKMDKNKLKYIQESIKLRKEFESEEEL